MNSSHDGRGTTATGQPGRVSSIFTRRRLDVIGGTLRSGTQDVGLRLTELAGRLRFAVHRRPLIALGVAAAIGFVVGVLGKRRVASSRFGR